MEKGMSKIIVAFGRWHRQNMMKEGAALAFYAAFSLAPLLFLLSKLVETIFGTGAFENGAVQTISRFAGSSGAALVQALVGSSYHASANPVLGMLGVVVLIFGGTNFFIQISEAFDIMAGVENKNLGLASFFKNRIKAFLLVIFSGLLIATFLFTTTGIAAFGNFLTRHFAVPFWFLFFLNFALSFSVAVLLFALLYRYLPSTLLSWRHAIIGALLTSVFLLLGEYLLGWAFAAGLVASYGLAGTVIAFLTWVYYSSLLFLFGAEVAYAYSEPEGD